MYPCKKRKYTEYNDDVPLLYKANQQTDHSQITMNETEIFAEKDFLPQGSLKRVSYRKTQGVKEDKRE